MANVLAIKQRKTYKIINKKKIKILPPTHENLSHAAAIKKATYWLNDGSAIQTSQKIQNSKEINKLWNKWVTENKTRYKEQHIKTRNPPKNTVLIEEMILIVGTDVEMTKKQEQELIKVYVEAFENKYNTKVRFWANHDHEGYRKDGIEHINRHYHIFFDNINNIGKSVRRLWKRYELSNMQTDVYEIGKSIGLHIERAVKYEEGKAPKSKSHRKFRMEKEKEQVATTLDENIQIKQENKNLKRLLKKKDFNIKQLNIIKNDYEQNSEQQQEEIKNKENIIRQLYNDLIDEAKKVEKELSDLREDINRHANKASLVDTKNAIITSLEEDNELLKKSISDLHDKNKKLELEKNGYKWERNMTSNNYEHLKSMLSKYEENINEYIEITSNQTARIKRLENIIILKKKENESKNQTSNSLKSTISKQEKKHEENTNRKEIIKQKETKNIKPIKKIEMYPTDEDEHITRLRP